MPGLTVYLNRAGLNTIETDKTAVRATETVEVVLENHGKPTHVHLHLDDELATMGTIEETNWFVPTDEYREVPLHLSAAANGTGRLEITTGYGQERTTVDVEVTPPDEGPAGEAPAATDTGERRPDVQDGVQSEGQTGVSIGSEWIDYDTLRNPTTVTTSVAFLLGFLVLLFVDPIVAVSAGVLGVLAGLAVASYLGEWDPLGPPAAEE